jgi:hypothetical protein
MDARRWKRGALAAAVVTSLGLGAAWTTTAIAGKSSDAVIDYNAHSMYEYGTKWDNPYGLGEMALNDTRTVDGKGRFSVSAAPFQTGADFSVYDHLKYIAISHDSFPVPESGSLEFAVDIEASTPGTQPGRVVHGCYTDTPACGRPYAQPTIEGQQAGVVLNMISFQTGQLFDWFVSGSSVFALIERLPSNVTNPTLLPTDPGYVGLDKAYTQIVKVAPVKPGKKHTVAIRYTRGASASFVEYFLDGKLFTRVDHVGIPLDAQGVAYSGIYPTYQHAPGEELKDQLDSFQIGHGLFSLLDAFPFQHPDAPDASVSILVSERLFGQGAIGEFSNFTVTAHTD